MDTSPRPSQRQRLNLESATTTPLCQPLSPFSAFPTSSSMASPCPILPIMPINVPETAKQWPARMDAIDMSLGFHQVNQLKTRLDESLLTMFGKKIPLITYHDQRRYLMALTHESSEIISRTLAVHQQVCGLWFQSVARVPLNYFPYHSSSRCRQLFVL